MIRSAPNCFEAITPHRPTAPSPTTATVLLGPAFAATAAWWPVPITSVSVSDEDISTSSSATGSTTSVPSACGTRTASSWAPVNIARAIPPTMKTFTLQALATENTRAVRPQKRRQHQVAALDNRRVGADGLDDTDELVTHPTTRFARLHRLVRAQIAPTDRR